MKSNIANTLHFTLLKANKNTWKYLSGMKVKHLKGNWRASDNL